MKTVAISQSNYIPWRGYFDLINSVDEFILYDDMQFTKRDWRNRNTIKTSNGLLWLTIPVKVKGKFLQKINETEIDGSDWAEKHWKTIKMNYSKAPHFRELENFVQTIYEEAASKPLLTEVNVLFLNKICSFLGIRTPIRNSAEFILAEGKTERLVDICKQTKATKYISGPAAKEYLEEQQFFNQKIDVEWMNYNGYKSYTQLWGDYQPSVSIIDLIFNSGKNSMNLLQKAVP